MARRKFEIIKFGNILVSDLKGEWSKDTAQRFDRSLRDTVARLDNQDWGHIIVLEEWNLGTPEFEPIIKRLGTWSFFNNVTATAIVYRQNALKDFQLRNLELKRLDEIRLQHFTEITSAIEWLSGLGFDTQLLENNYD